MSPPKSSSPPGNDPIDLASKQSFPASDAPPWTLGVKDVRQEHDTMGEVRVPGNALYGAQTQRAVDNFQISSHRLQPAFVRTLGLIKACAAQANGARGTLPPDRAAAIAAAAQQIADGNYGDQFVVDVFQSGSGTSTNMNANEVIGRLASAHPNDEVNRSQSSNDVIPSAIHVSAAIEIHKGLLPAMELLRARLEQKSKDFWEVRKIGRTHLQDATPMRLGEEFSGYAHQVKACAERVSVSLEGLYELPLGGTAIGTGINAPPGFAAQAIALISQATNLPFREAPNHFEAQAAKDAVLFLSGALRTYAVALTKIANDLRWLASGPRGGLGEIRLPELQPGSSIMPGKINPVIPECVLMACAQVVGHDASMTWACAGGNFELNTMMPLIAYDLLDSVGLLTNATTALATRCVSGVSAVPEKTGAMVEESLALATALAPAIGYEKASVIAQEAAATNRTIRQVALEKSGLEPARIEELLKL